MLTIVAAVVVGCTTTSPTDSPTASALSPTASPATATSPSVAPASAARTASPLSPTYCGPFSAVICSQAVAVAVAALPPNENHVLTGALGTTGTASICPPSVSFNASNPGTCNVLVHLRTTLGVRDVVLKLTATGWQFQYFVQ